MKKRLFYIWEKYGPPRLVELFDGREDLEKKMEIPHLSPFAKAHQKILDARRPVKWKKNRTP